MAKPSWLTTSPNSGSGNGSIQNTATVHTGREVRTGTVTVTATGVTQPKTYKVTQKAKPEFVSFDNGTEMSAPKGGGPLSITGKSNSESLTFSFVGDAGGVSVPSNYRANGLQTDNGSAISGDPGANAEYDVEVSLSIPENGSVEEKSRVLKVTTSGGQTAQITIKQAAGDAFIRVTPETITLEADGSAVSVNVESNTTWTVS